LTADHAPLVITFLDAAFREPNNRFLSESQLTVLLDDHLYGLRQLEGADAFPRDPVDYLTEWAENGWVRRFYPPGTDEPHFDLTPATERALQWIDGLLTREFVGTESRLVTAVGLLREMAHGMEEDPETRIARLEKEKADLNRQIDELRAGSVSKMDPRTLRERFVHFGRIARELLSDFRAVEHNFRELDRRVRERIAAWTEDKGALLQSVFGEHDQIGESDEGRSFRAFWDFLMSPKSQSEITELLDAVYANGELGDLRADTRLRRIHYDWITAGEQTQRTVARLSRQLRRFLDDQAFLENRRIIGILDSINRRGIELRDRPPKGAFMEIDGARVEVSLPMERPLWSPPEEAALQTAVEDDAPVDVDVSSLYEQVVVDSARLRDRINRALVDVDQISLGAILRHYPLEHGLTELIAYVSLATKDSFALVDDEEREVVTWTDGENIHRRARIPRVVFQRSTTGGRER
jgi:hypothetical protein